MIPEGTPPRYAATLLRLLDMEAILENTEGAAFRKECAELEQIQRVASVRMETIRTASAAGELPDEEAERILHFYRNARAEARRARGLVQVAHERWKRRRIFLDLAEDAETQCA